MQQPPNTDQQSGPPPVLPSKVALALSCHVQPDPSGNLVVLSIAHPTGMFVGLLTVAEAEEWSVVLQRVARQASSALQVVGSSLIKP